MLYVGLHVTKHQVEPYPQSAISVSGCNRVHQASPKPTQQSMFLVAFEYIKHLPSQARVATYIGCAAGHGTAQPGCQILL